MLVLYINNYHRDPSHRIVIICLSTKKFQGKTHLLRFDGKKSFLSQIKIPFQVHSMRREEPRRMVGKNCNQMTCDVRNRDKWDPYLIICLSTKKFQGKTHLLRFDGKKSFLSQIKIPFQVHSSVSERIVFLSNRKKSGYFFFVIMTLPLLGLC